MSVVTIQIVNQAIEIPLGFLCVLLRVILQPHAKEILQSLSLKHTHDRVRSIIDCVLDNLNSFCLTSRVVRR